MMRAAEVGSFSRLVVWESSRLSRQTGIRSTLAVVWQLEDLGIEVASATEKKTGIRLADHIQQLVRDHTDEQESATKSERVRSGKHRGILQGVHQGAWACFGFDEGTRRPSPFGNRLIKFYAEDPEAGPVMREILRRYVAGQNPQQLAAWLNDAEIPPPRPSQYHPLKRRGGPEWHQSSIRDLISSPLLVGYVAYRGRRVKACSCATLDQPDGWAECEHDYVRSVNVPAIVSKELWNEAQRVMRVRSSRPAGSGPGNHTGRGTSPETAARFLLSGLIFCERCGERVGCKSAKKPRNKDKYRCRGRRMHKCDLPPIDRATLDAAVLDHLRDRHMDVVDVQATVERERARLEDLRSTGAGVVRDELRQVQAELAEVARLQRKAEADYEAGDLTARLFARLDARYDQRRSHAEKARDRLKDRLSTAEGSTSTADLDAVLDAVLRVRKLVEGTLDADTTPMLQDRLRLLFEEFRVDADKSRPRIIVRPVLRPEHRPEGRWRELDFSEGDATPGVDVVDYLGVELTQMELLPNSGSS